MENILVNNPVDFGCWLTLPFMVKFNLKSKCTLFLDCLHDNSLPIQVKVSKFGLKM